MDIIFFIIDMQLFHLHVHYTPKAAPRIHYKFELNIKMRM